MKVRTLRVYRQHLQGCAVPHRGWVRRHEWHYLGRLWDGQIGRFEGVRVVVSEVLP